MRIKKRFNFIALLIYCFMGVFLASSQTLVTNITSALGGSETEMGAMISSMYAGSTFAVVFFGELSLKLGKKKTVALTACIICVGAAMIFAAFNVLTVCIGFLVYGSGVGAFESILLSLIADNNGEDSNRVVNFMQSFFSAGAMAAPLILTALFAKDQFRPLYVFVFLWYALAGSYLFSSRDVDSFVNRDVNTESGVATVKLLKSAPLLIYMLCMFIYLGSETAFTYWIGSYLSLEGFAEYGAVGISVYWFSSIFGRLLASRFRSASMLMPPCFALAAVGCVLLLVFQGIVLKLAAVVIIGIAYAPVYAGLLLMAGELFPSCSAPAMSLMIFSAGIGGMLFQPLISPLVASGNASALYKLLSAFSIGCAVMLIVVRRRLSSDSASKRC